MRSFGTPRPIIEHLIVARRLSLHEQGPPEESEPGKLAQRLLSRRVRARSNRSMAALNETSLEPMMRMKRNRQVATMLGSLFFLMPAMAVAAPQSRAPTAILSAGTIPTPTPAELLATMPLQEEPLVLELSLRQVVELALRHNLQVRISSLNPDLTEEQIRFARSRFDPVFVFSLPQQFNRSTQPTSSVLGGADVLTRESIVAGFNVAANTSFGLGWSFSGNASRLVTNNEFSTFNPQYTTSMTLGVRQPLLRNFGRTANRQQLLVAQNDFTVSRHQFGQQLQQQMVQVIIAYWSLVSAYRNVDIAEQSLELARQQLERNNAMVRIGTLAAVDVIQTEQQAADAELTLIQSQIAQQNQQDQMKALLNLDSVVAEGWTVEVVPTDEPAIDAPQIDIDLAVAEALEKSPLIRLDQVNVQSRMIDLKAARNGVLPQLDLVGSATLNGLGGDQIFRSGGIFGSGGVVEVKEGGLSDSLSQLLSGDFRNWSVGLQVSFPVRNDAARAQHAQASIRETQARTQLQDRQVQIRLAVQQAARNVTGGVQQVNAAENALVLAERQYAAELRRFEAGISSTFQVLNFQRQLTLARQRRLLSLIGLNMSLANLEFSKGTLLEQFGIEIDDAGAGGPMMRSRAAPAAQLPAPGSDLPAEKAPPR